MIYQNSRSCQVSTNRGLVRVRAEDASDRAGPIDLLVYAIGYESRSGYLVGSMHGRYERGLGIRFRMNEVHSFDDNLKDAKSRGDKIAYGESTFELASSLLAGVAELGPGRRRVLVDISSFPRTHLATIVSTLSSVGRIIEGLCVTFSYSFARYSAPPEDHGPVVAFGAVAPEFAGLGNDEGGLAAVISLGYENELALSAQQLLDPVTTWLAVPRGEDPRFDASVLDANEVLLDVVDDRNVWYFDARNVFQTFVELEQIVSGLCRSYDVVIVPMGPKVAVLAALLVSAVHDYEVGVWRLSPGGLRTPRQQSASGTVVSVVAEFG